MTDHACLSHLQAHCVKDHAWHPGNVILHFCIWPQLPWLHAGQVETNNGGWVGQHSPSREGKYSLGQWLATALPLRVPMLGDQHCHDSCNLVTVLNSGSSTAAKPPVLTEFLHIQHSRKTNLCNQDACVYINALQPSFSCTCNKAGVSTAGQANR